MKEFILKIVAAILASIVSLLPLAPLLGFKIILMAVVFGFLAFGFSAVVFWHFLQKYIFSKRLNYIKSHLAAIFSSSILSFLVFQLFTLFNVYKMNINIIPVIAVILYTGFASFAAYEVLKKYVKA